MSEYILEMLDIVKTFPGVQALKGVKLQVRPGTVHALMGENGAGKSTLMKCLIGIQGVTSGKIIYKGEEVSYKSTKEALGNGLSMIHQELSPVPERSVADNVWLGREPLRAGIALNHSKMLTDTEALFKQLEVDISPKEKMGKLSVSKMQMVEIAKAVSYNSSIVIMDEPTSALTQSETAHLFKIIGKLKNDGVAIIYISHKMDEIFQICDEVTVYRDGAYISTNYVKDMTPDKLIQQMVGRELKEMFPKLPAEIGETVMKVEHLSSGHHFSDVSFELRRGEILGFAGLVGAGRTEIAETIFGLHPVTGGKIFIKGREVTINSPVEAIRHKIGLLTEDRRVSGIVAVLAVSSNLLLSNLRKYGFVLKQRRMKTDASEYVGKLSIKTPSLATQMMNLSGGNQQKVLVSRWLLTDPDILLVDEPTRGIDVGAKAEIHTLISKLAQEGKAIIMISSEMPEVLGMSDRILVMHEGRMAGIVDREDATQEVVMEYATKEVS